jgi:hypothetical protein
MLAISAVPAYKIDQLAADYAARSIRNIGVARAAEL